MTGSTDQQRKLRVGQWLVEPPRNQITRGADVVKLEPRAMAVLVYLSERAGAVVSREDLMREVWQRRHVSDAAINRMISKLRRALDDDPSEPTYLETIPKGGYRLLAPVSSTTTEMRPRRWRPGVAGTALAALATAVLWLWLNQPASPDRYPTANPTVFTTLSGNEDRPAFSPDGRWLAFSHRSGPKETWNLHVKSIVDGESFQITASGANDNSPSWSPDGARLAFHRWAEETCTIELLDVGQGGLPAGPERTLFDCHPSSASISVDWSPDGRKIYFSDADSDVSPYRIYRYDLDTGARTQLTHPPTAGRGDYRLSVASDGQRVAFLRNRHWFDTEIRLLDVANNSEILVREYSWILFDIGWGLGGELLLANPSGRIEALRPDGKTTLVHQSADRVTAPTLSRQGDRLAFVSGALRQTDVWTSAVAGDARPILTSTGNERLPTYRRDGTLAFVSDRGGLPQIWLLDVDGRERQLTRFEEYSDPSRLRWTPDQRYVLSNHKGRLYRVAADTGEMEYLTSETEFSVHGSWAADGGGIYYARETAGQWDLWRLELANGQSVRVTSDGGYCGEPDPSGRFLYYTKYDEDGLWQLDLSEEHPPLAVLPQFDLQGWNSFQVVDAGVYFSSTHTEVALFDPQTRTSRAVFTRPSDSARSFSVSPDGLAVAYARQLPTDSRIVIMERPR